MNNDTITTDLSDRKAWKQAEWGVAQAYPGKKETMLGSLSSRIAYVPKADLLPVVVYKTTWPGYSAGRGSCEHYGWEAWSDGTLIASADTMRDVIATVAKRNRNTNPLDIPTER